MAAPCFIIYNAPSVTTGPPAHETVATSQTGKILLQVAPSATKKVRIIEWGYSFLVAPANNVRMELLDSNGTFATGLTAHVASGVMPYNDAGAGTSTLQLGTALTGYGEVTATPTNPRALGYQVENGVYFKQQFPLGREPEIAAGSAAWIRCTTGASAVDVSVYVIVEE